MTATLHRVLDDEARVRVGPYEYQLLISEFCRRQLMFRIGQELEFHISEYLEGNSSGNRFVPRKIAFLSEVELEFFELFCTVDKIGVKKALKAMARGVRDIAQAIHRQDVKWLTTLPGIGPTSAEQIVSTLRKKIIPYVTDRSPTEDESSEVAAEATDPAKPARSRKASAAPPPAPSPALPVPSERLLEDLYEALMAMGMPPPEARDRLDRLIRSGQPFTTHEEALVLLFRTPGGAHHDGT